MDPEKYEHTNYFDELSPERRLEIIRDAYRREITERKKKEYENLDPQDKLQRNMAELLAAIKDLLCVLKEAKPEIQRMVTIAEKYGYIYMGPNMTANISEVETILERIAK